MASLDASEIAEKAAPVGQGRLQWRMLIGFVAGLGAGLLVYTFARDAAWLEAVVTYVTNPIGQIFLRLLFMLVIPLLFSALVVGIAEMGEVRALKKIGLRTLLYTVVVSSIAVAISIGHRLALLGQLSFQSASLAPRAANQSRIELAEGIEHIDFFEVVTLSDFEVVKVMRRCDLDRTRALLRIGVFVPDDRNLPADERQLHLRTGFDECRIALILGMHRNARVARRC